MQNILYLIILCLWFYLKQKNIDFGDCMPRKLLDMEEEEEEEEQQQEQLATQSSRNKCQRLQYVAIYCYSMLSSVGIGLRCYPGQAKEVESAWPGLPEARRPLHEVTPHPPPPPLPPPPPPCTVTDSHHARNVVSSVTMTTHINQLHTLVTVHNSQDSGLVRHHQVLTTIQQLN